MAKQHFYSRVPARISLFNRMDGYDTFAHSDGVSREMIENELSSVCQNAPNKEESAYIRANGMPSVYCQFAAEDGTVVQSAVSYLKSDYTGERSAYMVHSLLLSEEEKKAHFSDPKAAAFDPELFAKDLSAFDLTSSDAKPLTDYPELPLSAIEAASPAPFVSEYDTGMLKRLIYAMIGVSCGKTKALFLAIPGNKEEFSLLFLDFMNSILQIFPYHMRSALSFVSYVPDCTRFTSFRIRGILESTPNQPTAKGVTLKMYSKDYAGIGDDNIAANAAVVDFFYGLLTNNEERLEFLKFCEHAVEVNPALEKANLKTLADLVFLFRALGGFSEERQVLPNDDAVYNFVGIYEKNREVLSDEYRARSMKCLKRYPEKHQPIPKNIFAKVSRIYPTETAASRQTIMANVLELIHIDAMREKLFEFIKENYESETAETKEMVMQDLCRVYYGGFLQSGILAFFEEKFENEPATVRSAILERLLLTIRTPQIQNEVLAFIDRFYDSFTEEEKDHFYSIFYEMLPEADALARTMANVVDDHVEEDRKQTVADHILQAVDADEKKHEPALCGVLATKCGFTEAVIAKKTFGDWSNRKIVSEFASCICAKSVPERVDTICEVWREVPDMKEPTAEKLLESLREHFAEGPKPGLFELIDSIDKLEETKKEHPASASFCDSVRKDLLEPMAGGLIPTCFDLRRYPDGVAKLAELSKDRPYLTSSEGFACVDAYRTMLDATKAKDFGKAFTGASKLDGKALRQGAATLFKKETDALEADPEQQFCIAALLSYLKTDAISFSDAAGRARDAFSQAARAENSDANADETAKSADENALKVSVSFGAALYSSELPVDKREKLLAADSEVAKQVSSFLSKYEKKGKKTVQSAVEALNAPAAYKEAVLSFAEEKQSGSGGFFKKLFHK